MKTFSHIVLSAAALALAASSASAQQVNALVSQPRVYNDWSLTNLQITNNNALPGNIGVFETNYVDDAMGGTFANRHDFMLSSDGGVTARTLNIAEGFTFSANVNLSTTFNAPRKEAGIRINSGTTGDTLFIVNSDAGEIVVFGGGAPFFLFGNNGNGNGYTPGSTIQMGLTYTPGTNGNRGLIEYFIDRDVNSPAGFQTSGPLSYDNVEGGPINANVGLYTQVSTNRPTDSIDVSFSSINASVTLVPEPATLGLFSAAAVGLLARRHK